MKECIELAPLHNPHNIKGIEICQKLMPNVAQVGVFDNTLHRHLPEHVFLYALPYEFYEQHKIRKYGFHGISFEYMTQRASEIVGIPLEKMRVVSLMLGSGCTANAMKWGRSVDVSTGFTPSEGLIQSTRAGDVDPPVITHLMRKFSYSPEQIDDILYKKSGWLGISGISSDMREIERAAENGNKRAQLAIDAVAYRAKKYIGAYAAAMGGIDMLVIAGGVGENSAVLRKEICEELDLLGIQLDLERNNTLRGEGIISKEGGKVPIVVVNTDEEIVIARQTVEVLQPTMNRGV